MIPIYIISLPEATDRRARITAIFNEWHIPFEFFDAVDGRAFNVLEHPVYDAAKRLRYFGKHLNGGEIGCLLSHKKLYQKIVDEEIDRALVLEDDVILRDPFFDVLEKILNCPVPYDMIRFLGSPKLERLPLRHVYSIDETYGLFRHTGMPGGAHATLVTYKGAQKILKHLNKTAYPIDALLGRSWETGLDWYTVRPGLATQELSFDSSIGDTRFDRQQDIKGLAKVLYPITRAWFKLTETIGKKYRYYKTYLKDKKYG